jgi:pyruvate dehydrogenase E1 component alpha subunit
VPLAKQTAAPGLAYKGVGYGVRSLIVDGNDAAAVHAAVRSALADAAGGHGPTLIEAITYRVEAHTNADDATRYRESDEVQEWLAKDPIDRLETFLRDEGLLDDDRVAAVRAEAEDVAAHLRDRLNADPVLDPSRLFDHVYASPTAALEEQREFLLAEIAEHSSDGHGGAA